MVLQELSKDTVRLIKSTQVITTPVSVVKELLENSIDAAATAVTIRLENHGFSLIEVRDNGSGIEDDDMKFIAKPHFTSKILTFADLASLNTYGFRGEALASLCSVSEVTVTTKTKDNVMGHTYTFDNSGNVTSKKPAAAPNGTSIVAKNLFKNLPVRKHYYSSAKRRKEELKKVEDLLLAFTLAAPKVHLTFTHDKCVIIQKSSVKNIQEALMSTFPTVYKDLVLKEKRTQDVHVEAYLPAVGPCDNPALSRTTSDHFYILVNQRPVFHKSIEKLVKAFYSQRVQGSHGRYPLGVVSMSLPLASVDINLEPNKTKILLNNEKQIIDIMQEILTELYGPLDQLKKNDENDVTCTLGTLKDSQMMEKENCNSAQSIETIDDFDMDEERYASLGNRKINTTTGGVGRTKAASNNTREQKSNCGRILEENIQRKPFQVRHAGKEEGSDPLASEQGGTSSAQLTINNKTISLDQNNTMCASTPKGLIDVGFPSISESEIIPDDDDLEDFLNENDADVTMKSEGEISGIVPLSLSYTNKSNRSEMKDDDNNPSEQHHTDSVSNSNLNESKHHESFTGSDGIPVYKIPALLPSEEIGNADEEENSKDTMKQRKDVISEESVDQIPALSSDLESIQEGRPKEPEEREGRIGGAWSRGMPIDGKSIQTVQLVNKPSLGSKPHLEPSTAQVDAVKKLKRLVSLDDSGLSATPAKKTKINSLSPSGYEYIYGKPVKKPSSPFILFSRDIRRQVLSEHPGADFAFVAKEMAQRWKTLDQDSKNHYRDLAKAEADKYQMAIKEIRQNRSLGVHSPLGKGCKTSASLDRYIAPLTPYIKIRGKVIQEHPINTNRPWLQHKKDIKCSLDIIKRKLRKRRPAKNDSVADALSVLGRVTSSGGWVCVQGSNIMALNVYRIYEVVLYNNLLKTFKVPAKPLNDPIPFNASTVGMENWAALLKLPRELVPDRNFYCISDQRLLANGFHVALFPGATTNVVISHGEIMQMTDSVGFYGVNDLKEILSCLVASPLTTLQYTRPLKLQHWIKGETVRMVRSAPNILKQDDVIEKVKRLHLTLNGEKNQLPASEHKCMHGRPLFTELYSLENLSCPKQKQYKILNKDMM